jgi:2'-5' RNA ligase
MDTVNFEPFDLVIDSIGRFKRDSGDIWWAGIAESKPLLGLHHNLNDKLAVAGFYLERRNYHPHITLGRSVVTSLTPQTITPFGETVSSVELMKSERINGILTYTAIHKRMAQR